MSIEAQALATARAASAEVGSGAIDSVVAGCDLIRFGVFFDGTHNFRDTAGNPERSWHSNVDLLEEQYQQTEGAAEIETLNGQPRKVKYMKRYFRGIGVKKNGDLQNLPSGALGTGAEGVLGRVNEASGEILQRLRTETGDVTPCELWFDTFGFSRGAAAARFFTNRVKRNEISYNGARNTTQFLGLFDTVASVINLDPAKGFQSAPEPSDPYAHQMAPHIAAPEFDPNVDIRTGGNGALEIYHITAEDEIRRNFPSSSSTGATQTMVGAHADIGGGYRPGQNTEQLSVVRGSDVWSFYRDNWHIGRDGNELIAAGSSGSGQYSQIVEMNTISVTARFGLQLIALELMHKQAVEKGVPFPDSLPDSIKGQTIPEGLLDYRDALLAGRSVSPAEKTDIRSQYANWSAKGGIAHQPERTARRRRF